MCNTWQKSKIHVTVTNVVGIIMFRSKLNSGENFLSQVDSHFSLSPSPNNIIYELGLEDKGN